MIHRSRLLLFAALSIAHAALRAQDDTTAAPSERSVVLQTFEVVHLGVDRRSISTTTVDPALLMDVERSSLRGALALVPGVQMDERGHGGSMRLSIRGSLLRSPFGVRGVKVYWGPFPLTLADGSTPLELLDPLLVGELGVVRSVGQARFGAAPCGLLLATAPFGADSSFSVFGEAIAGSNGFFRFAARTSVNGAGAALTAGLLRQRNDGYRDQEWSARDQAFLATRFGEGRSRSEAFLTWQHANWGLPGSLDEATAHDFPTSARPYCTSINAHVDKRQVFGGVAGSYDLKHGIMFRAGASGCAIDKNNPYGTSAAASGSKEEDIASIGARSSLAGGSDFLRVQLRWETGAEVLWERDRLDERVFSGVEPDTLRISATTIIQNLDLFATLHAEFPAGWSAMGSVGTETTAYAHEDLLASSTASIDRRSGALPMLAIEKRSGRSTVHLRYAESTSRATVTELLGSTDEMNADLRPERWQEVEIGSQTLAGHEHPLSIEFSAYMRTVSDLITASTTPTGTDYANTGRALISGIESRWSLDRRLGQRSTVRFIAMGAVQRGSHSNSGPDGEDLDMAGLEGLQLGGSFRIQHGQWPYVECSGRFVAHVLPYEGSEEPLPDFGVLNLRMGRSFDRSRLEVFAQCENLLDTFYNSWVQVNDPGGRYYNPAPGRSFQFGVRYTAGGGVN